MLSSGLSPPLLVFFSIFFSSFSAASRVRLRLRERSVFFIPKHPIGSSPIAARQSVCRSVSPFSTTTQSVSSGLRVAW